MTYETLCSGRNYTADELPDTGFWYGSVVIDTEYADETLPWLGLENYEVINNEQD